MKAGSVCDALVRQADLLATFADVPRNTLPGNPPHALYDRATDLGEQKNLAKVHPERVAVIKAVYDGFAATGRSAQDAPASPPRP